MEYYAAGTGRRKSDFFARIVADAEDIGAHHSKGPSFQEFTFNADAIVKADG